MLVNFTVDGIADGPANMGRDRELFDLAVTGAASCRLYGWDGPWVSLGRFQTREEAVVPSFQRVVSRTTGGKAVLHGHDQTVGLALPFTSGSVKEAYCAAIRPLIRALNLCGADCGLVTETANERGNSPDCFATASAYDLVHQPTGRKLAGVAMRINRSALLLQASIPYREPLIEPSLAIVDAAQVKLAPWDWRSFPEALGEFFFQELAA